VIGEGELNFWMQPDHPLASHAVWGGIYRQNMKTLAAIKDRIRTVKPDGEVVPGITAIATPGHTPGHTSVQIASGSNQLLCTADVVGNRAVAAPRLARRIRPGPRPGREDTPSLP
jgi:glyoxylase-like metal-dependent hydrolase (beta-lactamase superfamily II)